MDLSKTHKAFVLHFGEMGSRWGINRTVGQIYAVLFLLEAPLNAEQITQALGLSRSNVSMGLKELQTWRLVKLLHLEGDRRDYFTTPEDQWEIIRILAEERKKREVDPTLTFLREALLSADDTDEYAQKRISDMHDMIETLTNWYDDISQVETERLIQLMKFGAQLQKVINLKEKLFSIPGGIQSDAEDHRAET